MTNTDEEWEKWGQQDPYFGVMTEADFRSQNLTEASKERFFETGAVDIAKLMEGCRKQFGEDFAPSRVLEFGCGTGRLLVPMAGIAEEMVGLDISESMLAECRRNCEARDLNNVTLHKSDDALSNLQGRFNLIYSFMVLQHIPEERAVTIFEKLIDHLAVGGVAAIQLIYSNRAFVKNKGFPDDPAPWYKRFSLRVFLRRLLNMPQSGSDYDASTVNQGKDPGFIISRNNLNEICFILQSAGIDDIHIEFTDHGGEMGVYMYFRR